MLKALIIADDLTGANATGVLLSKLGLRVGTVVDSGPASPSLPLTYDVAACPTDSRALPKEEAYRRVYESARSFLEKEKGIRLYNKRIDSTLRGNLGAEIDAMLDALGERYMAAVVPCFPSAGRVAIGGYLLVNGTLLQDTDAAKDPKMPVHTSLVAEVLSSQSRHEPFHVPISVVTSGTEAVLKAILDAREKNRRLVYFDALEARDLETIARALVESGRPFVTVDPGPFTAAVARLLFPASEDGAEGKRKKILLAVGSVAKTSLEQMDEVYRSLKPPLVIADARKLVGTEEEHAAEVEKVAKTLDALLPGADLLCLTTSTQEEASFIDLEATAVKLGCSVETVSSRINDGIAEISARLLGPGRDIGALYSSGGDVTVALCRRLGAGSLELRQEVLPLAAFAKLRGGPCDGLNIVTKGGMVGDRNAVKTCVQFLKEQLRT